MNNFVRNYKQNGLKLLLNEFKDVFISEFDDENHDDVDVRFLNLY